MERENIEDINKINEDIEDYFASFSIVDEDTEYIEEENESRTSSIFYTCVLVSMSLLVISQVLLVVLKLTKFITH